MSDKKEKNMSLSEEDLKNVSGGWESFGTDGLHCPSCGNADRDEVSYQFWASMFMDSATKYRCKKCNHYFKIDSNGGCSDLGTDD